MSFAIYSCGYKPVTDGGITMKKGHIVTIYEEPLKRIKPEGKAQLIERWICEHDMEYWQVQFIEDGMITERWIAKAD